MRAYATMPQQTEAFQQTVLRGFQIVPLVKDLTLQQPGEPGRRVSLTVHGTFLDGPLTGLPGLSQLPLDILGFG